jgi:hypothetical protein
LAVAEFADVGVIGCADDAEMGTAPLGRMSEAVVGVVAV